MRANISIAFNLLGREFLDKKLPGWKNYKYYRDFWNFPEFINAVQMLNSKGVLKILDNPVILYQKEAVEGIFAVALPVKIRLKSGEEREELWFARWVFPNTEKSREIVEEIKYLFKHGNYPYDKKTKARIGELRDQIYKEEVPLIEKFLSPIYSLVEKQRFEDDYGLPRVKTIKR